LFFHLLVNSSIFLRGSSRKWPTRILINCENTVRFVFGFREFSQQWSRQAFGAKDAQQLLCITQGIAPLWEELCDHQDWIKGVIQYSQPAGRIGGMQSRSDMIWKRGQRVRSNRCRLTMQSVGFGSAILKCSAPKFSMVRRNGGFTGHSKINPVSTGLWDGAGTVRPTTCHGRLADAVQ
jgi:hypothetical protein